MAFFSNEPVLSYDDISRLFDLDPSFGGGRRGGHHSHGVHRGNRGSSSEPLGRGGYQPKMDIYEAQDTNKVTAVFELPGLAKEAINLDISPQNGRLTVSGENVLTYAPKEDGEYGWVHRERQSGRFSRTIPLPAGTEVSLIHRSSLSVLTKP